MNLCCTSLHRVSTPSICSLNQPLETVPSRVESKKNVDKVPISSPELPERDYLLRNELKLNRTSQRSEKNVLEENYEKLKKCGWYWGTLSWHAAECLLVDRPDGSFLIRDSAHSHHLHTLTFRCRGAAYHIRIGHSKGFFYIVSNTVSLLHPFSDIVSMVNRIMELSASGTYKFFVGPLECDTPPLPIELLFPVSQFTQTSSLQHICRRAVLNCMQGRLEEIRELGIPRSIEDYLLQPNGYFIDNLAVRGMPE